MTADAAARRPGGAGHGSAVVGTLDRVTGAVEAPLRRAVGSHRLNPLPHAGTISVWLLGAVVLSGLYLTVFFQFGLEASYDSVRRMHDHPIQSAVRTLHRYASAALVVTTLVHAWRVFVAGRFRGPRRWRWTSGVVSLLTVWLAGVTGYWLVRDVRAAALDDVLVALLGGSGRGTAWLVRDVIGSGAGSGWPFVFAIWLVHLLLTVVIGYALWRHVRGTRLAVLPPRRWMAMMGVALVVVSVLLPAELLDPATPDRLPVDLPLDPFVMFLLPPLLGGAAWLVVGLTAVVVLAAMAAPHLVRRRAEAAVVDPIACTGCDLCVADCPYEAIATIPSPDLGTDEVPTDESVRTIVEIDPEACVSCGICVGSCSFGALTVPGVPGLDDVDTVEVDGRTVLLACERHLDPELRGASGGTLDDGSVVVSLVCSGVANPRAIGSLLERGATGVHVVGCAPGDCSFGVGNEELAERLDGTRAPHIARRWSESVTRDFVSIGELRSTLGNPGRHHDAAADRAPGGPRRVVAAAVVLASVLGVAVATQLVYRGTARAGVRVVVDHVPGRALEDGTEGLESSGLPVVAIVRADGVEVERRELVDTNGAAVGVVDVEVVPGEQRIEVVLAEAGGELVLYRDTATIADGRRLVVEALDAPLPPGVDDGRAVFADRSRGGCGVCHSTDPGDDGVGPSLAGVGETAANRVAGLDAEAYLRQSILDPDAYVVEGYRAGQMPPIYLERLTPVEIDALVEYLMSIPGGDR